MATDATYDVFLSHATRDKPAVEELARQLKAAGLEPFLDKWHLVPGEPWQEALEAALERSRTCAVFLGPGHLGPWQNEEMRDALDTLVQDKSRRVVPVLLPGAVMPEKKALPPFLRRLTWVEFSDGLNDPQAFHRLVCGIKGIPPGDGPAPAEPKPPKGTEPPAPARGSEDRPKKWPSRRLFLLLAAATLAAVIGTLGLLLVPPLLQRHQNWSPAANKPVKLAQATPTVCPPKEETNEAGIVFVRICPGTFIMGSTDSDPQAQANEKPAHQVTLSEFWLGKTEVTNKQYRRFQPNHQDADELPATDVRWDEAKAACKLLGGRLPTEAEWEYAARAGSQTAWSFGDDEARLDDYAWYAKNLSNTTYLVGMKKPNDWGLYDVHGNVWEWVADWFGTYSDAAEVDPRGPTAGEYRVLRGGSFFNSPVYLRSAFRLRFKPSNRSWIVGFRCARAASRQP